MKLVGVPKSIQAFPWCILEQGDINCLFLKHEVTLQALFTACYCLVRAHNAKRNNACMFWPRSIDKNRTLKNLKNSEDLIFFPDSTREILIVPFLESNHYFVAIFNYKERKIYYCDSMGSMFMNKRDLEPFWKLIDKSGRPFSFEYCQQANKLVKQRDSISCGILAMFNIETYLETGRFSRRCNLWNLRQKYGVMVLNFSVELGHKFKTPSQTKLPEDELDILTITNEGNQRTEYQSPESPSDVTSRLVNIKNIVKRRVSDWFSNL